MKKLSRAFLSILFIAVLALSPISSPQFSTVKTVEAAKIKLNKKKTSIYIGQKVQLKLTGTKKKIKWSTSKKSIATVTQKGAVTGKKAGTAVITAKVGKTAYTCKVTVKNRITVAKNALTINTHNTKASIKVTYKGNGTIYWKTSDSSIAQPSWSKKWKNSQTTLYITSGSKNGTATVTLTNTLNNEKVKINVTVHEPTQEEINAEKEKLVTITLENELPDTFSDRSYSGSINQIYSLEDFDYDVKYYRYDDDYTVTLKFTGKKLSDAKGAGQSRKVPIGWKLYDEDGYIVESGTTYTPAIAQGEGFRDAEGLIFDLKAGNYKLKILDTN